MNDIPVRRAADMPRPLIDYLDDALDAHRAAQRQEFREIMDLSLAERIEKGYTLAGVSIEPDWGLGAQGATLLPMARVVLYTDRNLSRFREGETVDLHHPGGYSFKMTVAEDSVDAFVLAPDDFQARDCYADPDRLPLRNWEVDKVDSDVNHRLLCSARNYLAARPSLLERADSLLAGTLRVPAAVHTERMEQIIQSLPESNPSQREAVRRCLEEQYFHLVQGPPGTGKTYTIGLLASVLLGFGRKVLLTAFTHTAINKMLDSASQFLPQGAHLVKVGDSFQAAELRSNPLVRRMKRFRSGDEHALPGYRGGGVGVGATPYALCEPVSKKLLGQYFDFVIIDEASQMSIPLCLAALSRGSRVVMVGDHRQLDPIVPSGSGNPLFASSIFRRLADLYPRDITMLDTSYRLDDQMLRIPGELFYGGRLKSAREVSRPYDGFDCPKAAQIIGSPSNEVLVLHHEFDAQGRSPYEAGLVADIVSDLLGNGVEPGEMAVITPYRAQVREVRDVLYRRGVLDREELETFFVDTVERMQGQERDYVVYTMANSNPAENPLRLDFFYSPCRLNVAMTRARCKCIVISNESVFTYCGQRLSEGADVPEGDLRAGMEAFLRYYELSSKVRMEEEDLDDW